MSLPRIAGTFADFKLIKTRDVCQFVVEIPREQADAALEALGGLPKPGAEQWVALAPIRAEAAVEHDRRQQAQATERKPMALASKVALTCKQRSFSEFLCRQRPAAWKRAWHRSGDNESCTTLVVYDLCDVSSRSEITENSPAADLWLTLEADYLHWQREAA